MFRGSKPKHIGCKIVGCLGKHEARGYCNKHYLRLWKHGSPSGGGPDRAERGTGWTDANGYRYVGTKQIHIVVAEKALGKKLPTKAVIHHIDGDRSNNANDNLIICPDQAYHLLIHTRQDAQNACGNANFRRCHYCDKHDDPHNMSPRKSKSKQGNVSVHYVHNECHNAYRRQLKNGNQHQ